jgi:hypothetical protein
MYREQFELIPLEKNALVDRGEVLSEAREQAPEIRDSIFGLERSYNRWFANVKLAKAYTDLGLDSDPLIEEQIYGEDSFIEPSWEMYRYATLVKLEAYRDDLEAAGLMLERTEDAGGMPYMRGYLDLAEAQIRVEIDPEDMLERATGMAGRYYYGEDHGLQVNRWCRIGELVEVAEVKARAGFDFEELLEESRRLLGEVGYSPNSTEAQMCLVAGAYAKHGWMSEALEIAKLHEDEPGVVPGDFTTRKEVHLTIALEQVRQEDFRSAIETAELADSNQVMTWVLSECAISGYQPEGMVERARTHLDRVEDSGHFYGTERYIFLHGLVGQAEAMNEMKPRGLEQAYDLTTEVDNFDGKINGYLTVARAVDRAGYDARPVLGFALRRLEEVPVFDDDSIDEIDVQISMEEVAEIAGKLACFDVAERAISNVEQDSLPYFGVIQRIKLVREMAKHAA